MSNQLLSNTITRKVNRRSFFFVASHRSIHTTDPDIHIDTSKIVQRLQTAVIGRKEFTAVTKPLNFLRYSTLSTQYPMFILTWMDTCVDFGALFAHSDITAYYDTMILDRSSIKAILMKRSKSPR